MKIPGFKNEWLIFGRIQVYSRNALTTAKNKAIKKAGVKKIRIHGMRHSHASILIDSGQFSVLDVSHRLGHSNANTTLGTYSHFYKKKDNKMSKMLDEMQTGIVKNVVK